MEWALLQWSRQINDGIDPELERDRDSSPNRSGGTHDPPDLEHIIRAAADVTRQQHRIIIGSQAILGQFPNVPEALLVSVEADLYAPDAPELSDFIDGALGPDTLFDKTHGYHADGVSPTTASLPAGWSERLTPICNPKTNGATGWCIEVHDIAVAKYAAEREKDLRYTGDLWTHGMLDPGTLEE